MDNLGRGWAFPPKFNRLTKTVEMTATDQEEIEQSLKILFSTYENERLFHPDYGCNLEKYKFENLSNVFIGRIKKLIEEAIADHEPRVTLNSLSINIGQMVEGKFIIMLSYTIIDSNKRYDMTYPYTFD